MHKDFNSLPLDPYTVGCLIGDGGLSGNLTFANKDLDIIEKVNNGISKYGYHLVKAYTNKTRDSEYRIVPEINNKIKYLFNYKGNQYTSGQLIVVLQNAGYKISSHDTILSISGVSCKTKTSTILKYYPELRELITVIKLKDSQKSEFLQILDQLNLRCRFDKKRIPKAYLTATYEARLALFQGLMDTDGSGSGHRLEFCVANKELADDFVILAESLGYTTKVHLKYPKYFNKKYNEYRAGKTAYRVFLNNISTVQPFLCQRKLLAYNTKHVRTPAEKLKNKLASKRWLERKKLNKLKNSN